LNLDGTALPISHLPARPDKGKVAPWPEGMRVLVRREQPRPGTQLDVSEERDGYRYQATATNTRVG
jgi:hypothetical protein